MTQTPMGVGYDPAHPHRFSQINRVNHQSEGTLMEPTMLDCLAYHLLRSRRMPADRYTRIAAVHLANRWGGVSHHYCYAGRHVR